MNLTDIANNFSDAEEARLFLEKKRWPDGAVCPFCGLVGEAYQLEPQAGSKAPVRPGVWKCGGCRKQFSVTVGTIFEDSHIPLNKWLMAIHLLCSSKKGMSAHQLHRMLGVTYKSAWFMAHRIRYAMTQDFIFSPKLGGTVEVDETYVGGKPRNKVRRTFRHGVRPIDHPYSVGQKAAVVSLVQRGGNVYSRHVQKVNIENLKPIINELITEDAHIMTDSGTVLRGSLSGRKHDQVNHTENEYVRYEGKKKITTNSVEGFFATLKRGINGTYHHVSKQHLHRYLSEFDFRYNARKIKDGERSELAIKGVGGKRLKYRDTKPYEPPTHMKLNIEEPF
jgi:transposase-like protein